MFGNLFEITVAPGRARKLEGDYTMMTEKPFVCPVGALTTKYWRRHKGRVWLLKGTTSVCPGCATGCNMWLDADPREQTAFRNRPRDNEEVNKYWMCDDGMLTYLRVQKDRVLEASVGRGKDAKVGDVRRGPSRRTASDLAKVEAGKLAVVLLRRSSRARTISCWRSWPRLPARPCISAADQRGRATRSCATRIRIRIARGLSKPPASSRCPALLN